MDKNKSRTDLLAAGRKKLQQFRQKKEGKGSSSHGKSSKRFGKSEEHDGDGDPDGDAASAVSKPKPIESLHIHEGETGTQHPDSSVSDVDSSMSQSMEDSLAPDINSPSVNPLLVPGPLETLREEMGVAFNSGLPVEGSEIDEAGLISSNSKEHDSHSLVSNEGESPKIIEAEMGIVASLENSEVAVHERESVHATSSVPVDLTAPLSVPDDAMKSVLVSVDTESAHREDERKLLPTEQDIPDMFLIQAREDQVTDVGAMQEADSSGSKQLDSISGIGLEEDRRLDLSEFVEGTETQSGEVSGAPIMESTGEAEQSGSFAVACNVPEEFSVTMPGTDGASAVAPEMTDQWRENLVGNSDNEKKPGLISAPGDFTSYTEVAIQAGVTKQAEHEGFVQDYLNEGSYASKDGSFSRPLGTKLVSLSGGLTAPPGESVSSISLLQLAEALKGLDEDEFRFLLKSRDLALNARLGDTGTLHAPEYDFGEVLETFKERFYLANVMKDIFTEHSKLQMEIQMISDHRRQDLEDKISTLSVSLSEVSEINKSLTEEIAQSRSELLAVTNAREELKDQLQTVRAEVAESSGRVYELQNELERSRGDLSNLSLELANCKSLVEALQLDNSNLSSSLTSAIEVRKKLEEEKEYSILDNDKLSLELTKCKDLVAALQMENAELSRTLDFVTEERKKLEDEKEYVVHENDKLLSQVADSKALVVAIQLEHANVNGALALVTEEMKKLEEEKQSSVHEIDRLNSELAECRSLVEAMQVENANLSKGLSSITEERRKLEVEKDYLIGENRVLSSELCVNQDRISVSQADNLQLEADSREVKLCLEQLIQENIFLDSSLDIHKAKIKEINNMQVPLAFHSREAWVQIESPDLPSSAHENAIINEDSHQLSGKQDDEISSPMLEGTTLADDYAGGEAPKQLGQDAYSDSFGFVDLNGRFEEAEKIMLKLEKAIEEMHSHSASLSRAGGKAASSGVSKLIQAFESKTHLDDDEVETTLSTEDRSVADPFLLSKEQTANLRAALKKLGLEAAHASELFKGERNGREFANVAYREIKVQYEAMKEHTDILEAMNIEFEVQCEAFKHHICSVEDKKSELVVLYESLRQQNISREAENTELSKKLNYCQSRINELHGQLRELEQSSEEITSSISNQIEKLQNEAAEKLEAAGTDYEAICSSYNEVNNKLKDLQVKNELAVDVLHKIYCNLRELVSDSSANVEDSEVNLQNKESLYSLDLSKYEALMDQLGTFLDERLQLKSENNKLNMELVSRTEDVEELNRKCLDWNVVLKLVEDVEAVVKAEDIKIDVDKLPLSQLESFVSFLLQRYVEADEQVNFAREELRSKVMEFSEFQEKINQLGSLNLLQENEIVSLKESLSKAEESIVTVRSELQEKIIGLEQSEQRVSSVREKLSIAVAKGKGLIAQRDNLKQILAEKSIELERCSQELQLKDARVDEVETKLKTYSEAGERVEALESELSYIRNSATALRESFLLKDSVLQRIEEILEDLDLSENFHSRDIIEKVDWLARSVAGNSLPPVDWDHKSSVEEGAYSDAGFAVMDGWKEDIQPSSNPGDDLRRKYDELQSKFYGLAEQNEMLEQSLMERNNLVQRWEEVLDRINVPTQLRSMEPEDRIEWLGSALSEVHHHADSLQQKIGDIENYCGTLTTELEESKRRLLEVEAALQVVVHEKEHLSKSLKTLTCDHEKLSDRAVQFELENDKLQNELTGLQEKLVEKHKNEEQGDRIEGEIRRLQDLVSEALQDPGTEELDSSGSSIECLGGLVRKLVDNYTSLYSGTPMLRAAVDAPITGKLDGTVDEARDRDTLDTEEPDVVILKKELDEAFSDLRHMKEERDSYMERQQSLFVEVEALNKKTEELQELLSQEEKKSASVREKLNVAVRKGKLLVQQRDSLKQTIEELNNEVESLKSKNNQLENFVTQYEQKIKDLSPYPERVSSLESETLSLRNHLTETEHSLQEKGHTLKMILNTLGEIDVGSESSLSDPVGRMQQLGKLCSDLHSAVASSEHESRKSKQAAELLLAELNEVQERNDSLQEELAKAGSELIDLSKERDMAEAAKLEALSHLESLSSVHSEARKNEDAEFMALKSVVHQLRGSFFDINDLLADVLSKDLEFLHNLKANLESCLKSSSATSVVGMPLVRAHDGVSSYLENKEKFFARDCVSDIKMQEHFNDSLVAEVCRDVGHDLEGLTKEMGALKEKLQKHSISLDVEAGELFKIMEIVLKESASQTESSDSLKREIMHIESVEKEKGMENVVLRKNIALLYEACASSIMEIENRKAQIPENNMPAGDLGLKLKSAVAADGGRLFSEVSLLSSEELIRTMADGLLMVVKNLTNWEGEIVEGREKEMKTAIANLQKELQEKDIQRERICMELVSQIREAEAAATSYSMDFQSAKTRLLDLEKHMEVIEEERKSLGQRVKELQAGEATSVDLQERIRSMTEILAAKDQEIESLMQALDEEETQMEELTNKIAELEQVVHQKNIDFDNLEASRGKAMKKLSITVNKFDELHNLSANLLAEVEKLQSQLQDRDAEISFLRQEVTRCTNDVLVASQMSNKGKSDEILELLIWLDTVISQVQMHDVHLDYIKGSQVNEYKELLQKQITSIISELEDLRVKAQSKDALIQVERSRVEELTRKGEVLENSLRQKEMQFNLHKNVRDSGEATEIMEVEPAINNRTVPGTSVSTKVRSLRKANNDQVAIAIDMDPTSNSRLEDDDDDKVHGFKSLTTSRIVPRFTRPVTDMIDGLWVSCDRALMRQPALRLGIIIYWAVLHAVFATFVV